MRTSLSAILLAQMVLMFPVIAQTAPQLAFQTLAVEQTERGQKLDVTIWYPSAGGGNQILLGDNALFKGVPAMHHGDLPEGRLPLVLLSHGSGGNAANLSWIAAKLVAAGFIVAAPNHPGTTSGNSTPAMTLQMWHRPIDLSSILTALETNPAWRGNINWDKVGAMGFSLGGETVLELAGMHFDGEAFARYCDRMPTMPDCRWISAGADIHRPNSPLLAQSRADIRVKAIVAVDPGPATGFDESTLQNVRVPVAFINMGRPFDLSNASKTYSFADGTAPAIDARRLAQAIPMSSYSVVPDAIHFSFLGICKPNSAEILQREGEDDPICTDGGGRSRELLHDELGSLIVAAFRRSLEIQ